MTDHMWTAILDQDNVPGGCEYMEFMYDDDSIVEMCTCDYHWDVHLKKELPIFYRKLV